MVSQKLSALPLQAHSDTSCKSEKLVYLSDETIVAGWTWGEMKKSWAYGEYTDRTGVAGSTWQSLKWVAMRPEYKQSNDYVSK